MHDRDTEGEVQTLSTHVESLARGLITTPTPSTVALATTQFKALKDYERTIKERQADITAPLNEALKSTRALFAPVLARLNQALGDVRQGLADYNARTEAALDKQRAKLERKVEAGTITPGQADHALATKGEALGAGAISTSSRRVVNIVDPSLVPDRYWVLDEVLVRKDALAGRPIPGVEVVVEKIVVKPR